ncbi:hypothetical protein JYU34_021429 [Plutella xylostella]|uniref:Regulatory protein zeste n=1 Tax=Plutella xylostella TaxID=51655 RepID=A0ABQ7PUW5_PLUXY|nr:hypothetical protein JYU34_021429 [Plutella xylostella]
MRSFLIPIHLNIHICVLCFHMYLQMQINGFISIFSEMEPRQGRASQEQQMALLEFMENHGDLAKPQPGPQGRLLSNQLWTDLTELLNSMGGGVLKSTEKWKKVWADWKTKTKKKAILIKRHTSGTGGGPSNGLTLTAPEERLIAIMGVNAVEGQPNISELGFNVSYFSYLE